MMIYIRGNRRDYDEWRDLGCDGWGWDDLLPYFMRAEDNERGASDLHGIGGPLRVSDGRSRNPIAQAFIDAAIAYGLSANDDFNGAEQDGVGWYQLTQRDGRRASTALCYLVPAMERPNLDVETHVQVLRVVFEGSRAVGVQGVRLGEVLEFRARSEVILSAGAYQSPQLLMLSGIGRPDELAQLQIEPIAEVPGVGLNLHDHPLGGVIYLAPEDRLFGTMSDENMERALLGWAGVGAMKASPGEPTRGATPLVGFALAARTFESSGHGPFTSNGPEAGGFARTREGLDAPDVQLHCVPAPIEGFVPGHARGLSLGLNASKPKSRGCVTVASRDPRAKPLIVHNYYDEPEDLRTQVAGIRMCMEIARMEPLADWVGDPYSAPASDSDEDITALIRAAGDTSGHPVGTCKMGVDDLAVVDPQLRVRGVEGLRVADASIMPTVPRGNTNAPTIAVAEKAADVIRGRTMSSPGKAASAA
jgi:choline dehydrogenase-like flavoprotein